MLRITGGKVYDPANGIDGQIKDLFIDDSGRFASFASGGRTIDAAGMIVFPGGVDVHTHVAGGAINFARAMTPDEIHDYYQQGRIAAGVLVAKRTGP